MSHVHKHTLTAFFLSFFLSGTECNAFTAYLVRIHLPGLHC